MLVRWLFNHAVKTDKYSVTHTQIGCLGCKNAHGWWLILRIGRRGITSPVINSLGLSKLLVKTVGMLLSQTYDIGANIFLCHVGFHSILVHEHVSKRMGYICHIANLAVSKASGELVSPGTVPMIMPRPVNLISCNKLASILLTSPVFSVKQFISHVPLLLRVRLKALFNWS